MKRYFLIGTTVSLLFVVFFVFAQKNKYDVMSGNVGKEMVLLSEKYDSTLFQSLFALDDLKSISILQIQRLSESYNNKWIAPDEIVNSITKEEKDTLLKKIVAFIEKQDDRKQTEYLNKIKAWCKSDVLFKFIEDKMLFSKETILLAIEKSNMNMNFTDPSNDNKSSERGFDKKIESRKSYFNTLNIISSLNQRNQLKYYSQIYYQLSLLY